MRALLLVLLMSFPVMAQDFNLDDFTPVVEETELVEPVDLSSEPIVLPDFENLNVFKDFESESKARLEEMKQLAEEIKKLAEEIKNPPVKMTFEDARVLSLEDRVANLETKSLDFLTKAQVEEIVKTEVEKTVKLTFKVGDAVVEKTVPLNMTENSVVYNSVPIPGYSGTFEVPEGGYVVSVDGVPVNRSNSGLLGGLRTNYTNGYVMQGSRVGSRWRVRVASPVRSSCQMVNGVLQCN